MILPAMFHGRVATQIPSLTGHEPKTVEFKDIETETIEPEDLEPRNELHRNLGTGPCQIQESLVGNGCQNLFAEDLDEFGKVGVEMSYIQSQMHSEHDSGEHCGVGPRRWRTAKMVVSPMSQGS